MTAGRKGSDLGRWTAGASCAIECEDGCGYVGSNLELAAARRQARTHARVNRHHVTIERTLFQTVEPRP